MKKPSIKQQALIDEVLLFLKGEFGYDYKYMDTADILGEVDAEIEALVDGPKHVRKALKYYGDVLEHLLEEGVLFLAKGEVFAEQPFPELLDSMLLFYSGEDKWYSWVVTVLKAGANPDTVNSEGLNALQIAKKKGAKKIVELLTKKI